MHVGEAAAIGVERQFAVGGGVALGDEGAGLAAGHAAQSRDPRDRSVVRPSGTLADWRQFRLDAALRTPPPDPRPHASPRPPCHGARQHASERRWPSQAFANKGMARSGPGRGALVVGSAELEVAASLQRSGRSCTESRGGNFGNKLLTEITHAEWLQRVVMGHSRFARSLLMSMLENRNLHASAATPRVAVMSPPRPPAAGPLSRALDAPGCANGWHAARRRP
jgi:hypothetical protein